MTTKADEVIRAGLEPRKQVEPRNAPPRTTPAAIAVERDHDNRPVMPLDQPRGDDPDDARVPTLAGDDQPWRFAQVLGQFPQRSLGRIRHLPLSSPPLPVRPAQLIGDLRRPRLVIGQEQLDPSISPIEPPRRIDPRRQLERQIPLIKLGRLDLRRLDQRPQSQAAALAVSPPAPA